MKNVNVRDFLESQSRGHDFKGFTLGFLVGAIVMCGVWMWGAK